MIVKNIKIKIGDVPKYMQENRLIKRDDVYKVIAVGTNKHNERVYLFNSKNKKLSLAYDHEIKEIISK